MDDFMQTTGGCDPGSISSASKKQQIHNTSTATQCQELLALLLLGPVSTRDARNKLDIMSPAARIMELKEQGHNIFTYRQAIDGHKKVAVYVLLSGGSQ